MGTEASEDTEVMDLADTEAMAVSVTEVLVDLEDITTKV